VIETEVAGIEGRTSLRLHSSFGRTVEKLIRRARLTNRNRGLHSPTLRAPDEGKPASVVVGMRSGLGL
jgi:hypothetical protein